METTQLVQENKIQIIHNLLSFCLEDEIFAVSVTKVIEIMEVPRISKLPRAQPYMMGVINVRGTVLPLIDTRVKMGMSPITFGKNTCAIIIEIEKGEQIIHLGILVDSVSEVLEISDEEVQPTPSMEKEAYADFITGIISQDNDFVLFLDLDGLFSREEIQQIKVAGEMSEDVAASDIDIHPELELELESKKTIKESEPKGTTKTTRKKPKTINKTKS